MPANTSYVEGDIQRTAAFAYDPHTDRFVAQPEVPYGHDMRLEWQDVGGGTYKPIYVGTSADEAQATSATTWTITRFDWSAFGSEYKPTQIRTRLGAWDNRASLSW
jgi:hypothetical protein